MSRLPPTLREKRRYVLVQIDPAGAGPDTKDLYYAVHSAVEALWGDVAAAAILPAVVAREGRYAIVRCARGAERELLIALSTVTSCSGKRIALRTVATSGTIESLRGRMNVLCRDLPEHRIYAESRFDNRVFEVVWCEGAKIDVIEKGFKNAEQLFLTTYDTEDF